MRTALRVMLAILLAANAAAAERTTVIHAGTLLAIPGEAPTIDRSIVIDGQRNNFV